MSQNTNQKMTFINYCTLISAWFSFLLVLFVLLKGDEILQYISTLYPDWGVPAFFIPWFLLLISSVQKLRENQPKQRLQIWILKTTFPIFVFIVPFFSLLLSTSITSGEPFGFESYCIYLAIAVLFLVHFLPALNAEQKLVVETKP